MTTQPADWPKRVSIIGVGLLGGSVALAIKQAMPQCQIVGFSRTAKKREFLLQAGIVDRTADTVQAACEHADVVVVASLVDQIATIAKQAAAVTNEQCLITDVGSTKATIVTETEDCPITTSKFVAAHPIAGSEKTGAENATADLFKGKVVVLTPSKLTPSEQVRRATDFWQLTGGKVIRISPQDHDTFLAAVSHVPHLVSAAVSRLTPSQAGDLVGSGWRDITRVAAGDPDLWTAICQENRAAIISELSRIIADMNDLKAFLERKDDRALTKWLADAKTTKDNT